MDTVTCPTTPPSPEFRLADIAIYPAGAKQMLVHARENDAACILHTTYVELLKGCRDFQSLDAHLAAFCQGRTVTEHVRQGLRHKLSGLARAGYLVSREQVQALFQQGDEPPAQITTLGVPTCNRVETLQRGLTGYIEHCQRFGRALDIVVMDDSPTPTTRETSRQMLRTLRRRYGVNIAYAGLDEKRAFARALGEVGDIPQEVIFWACVGNREYGTSTSGANRNALLLHSVGECIFSSDDDMICRVAPVPQSRTAFAVSPQANLQTWFYADRQSALDATQPAEQDIFALHEQWLGHHPCRGQALAGSPDQLDSALTDPVLLHRLAKQPGRILVTIHGIVGDISCQSADILLFSEQLTCAEQAYCQAYAQREIAQGARQITLTQDAFALTGMGIGGLDNRELLPPFGPFGRCDDIIFGHTLATCFANASVVYLPWLLLHAPPETRRFSGPLFDIPFDMFLIGCLRRFQQQFLTTPSPLAGLCQLSQFLEHIAQLPLPAFEAFVRQIYWQGQGSMVSLLEKRLHEHTDRCAPSWRRDAEAYCAQARQHMLEPVRYRLPDGPETVQRATRQFALVLKWWPRIVESARRLRAEGRRLAHPVV
ncbi:MAG TPA: hypothetical protein VGF67_32575 [Ktedonobacteraceae bacterium]|jgi:hypothetical protein